MSNESEGIGWLRFDLPPDKPNIHLALFVTSPSGEPLEFSFIWGSPKPEDGLGISSLVETLVQSGTQEPLLLLAREGDLPKGTFQQLKATLPIGMIRLDTEGTKTDNPANEFSGNIDWIQEAPAQQSIEMAILRKFMSNYNLFEYLERAGKGLVEAFAQPNIQALCTIPGLKAPISLQPNNIKAKGRLVNGENNTPQLWSNSSGIDTESGFTTSLWQILAKPIIQQDTNSSYFSLQWPGTLMPFQKDGVQALINMERLLLSDDMGLGKTVQVIAALRILWKQGKLISSLIVTPASILDQWRQELNRWAPEMNGIIVRGSPTQRGWQWQAGGEFTLVSYDILRQDGKFITGLRSIENPWDVVVLDEAQRIKNRIKTSQIAKKLPRLRSWALTGTPLENHENELGSIIEYVDHVGRVTAKRYFAGTELRERHQQLQLRRKKADVLPDLPPKLETKLTIPLHPDQRKSYVQAEVSGIVYLKSLGKEVKVEHILALIVRLKQICNADPKTGASSKLENISERLQTLTEQGHKALIFSQFKSQYYGVLAAAKYLKNYNPMILTGDIPPEFRSEVVNSFKASKSHQALILSLKVGGVGLNLQEASYVFHLDRWWNPAVERQAEDRSHRMGQKVKVNVIKYSCENTIEERIDLILNKKQALFDDLIDDVSLDLSTKLNRKELLALFGLG